MNTNIDVLPAPAKAEEVEPFFQRIGDAVGPERTATVAISRDAQDVEALRRRLEAAAQTERGRQVLRTAALIVQTSGSTSNKPSLVALSAAAVTAGARATHRKLGGPGTWVVALPLQHIAGIQMLVRAAVAGIDPVLPHGWPAFTPKGFAEAIQQARTGSTRVYASLVSAQLAAVLDQPAKIVQTVASVDALLVGGGRISPALLSRAKTMRLPVHTTYGMTETSGGCVYDGEPLPGTRIKIEPETGRVLIATEALMNGYVDQDADWVDIGSELYFRSSDTGSFDANGALRIDGRVDEVIKSGGVKIATAQVADVLSMLPHVREAFCVGIEDEVWGQTVAALIVPNKHHTDAAQIAEAARDEVRKELGNAHMPRTVVVVDALPKTSIGKVSTPKAQALVAAAIRSGTAWRR